MNTRRTLQDLGELALIRRLRLFARRRTDVIAGIGDDCAVVRPEPRAAFDLVLTSDAVIEGTHFEPGTAPEAVGHKAAGRILSDLAAMGADPLWMLMDFVAPPRTRAAVFDGVCRGATRLARKHGLLLVGGDTAKGKALELHGFGVGRVPRGTAILRSGARPGDILFVTGWLGGSSAGRHLRFQPRVREGRWLRQGRWATAMIDISDGLAADLRHLAEASGAGARLDLGVIPISPAVHRMKGRRAPLEHAFQDGEDFELLFTVPPRRARALQREWRRRFRFPCTAIGVMTGQGGRIQGLSASGAVLPLGAGYEHFRRA